MIAFLSYGPLWTVAVMLALAWLVARHERRSSREAHADVRARVRAQAQEGLAQHRLYPHGPVARGERWG